MITFRESIAPLNSDYLLLYKNFLQASDLWLTAPRLHVSEKVR